MYCNYVEINDESNLFLLTVNIVSFNQSSSFAKYINT